MTNTFHGLKIVDGKGFLVQAQDKLNKNQKIANQCRMYDIQVKFHLITQKPKRKC